MYKQRLGVIKLPARARTPFQSIDFFFFLFTYIAAEFSQPFGLLFIFFGKNFEPLQEDINPEA